MFALGVRQQLCRSVVYRNRLPWSQRRSLFGMGEILSVLANPAETLRQLNESKDMLKKAKEELELSSEAKKIPPKHTFAKLPGFHGRKVEQAVLRKIFSNEPQMTVVFGATSVGKTALLRQVLATDDFYVIKFDLRISGFADLRTLYIALCQQFERFFEEMRDEEMDKNKLTFKHLVVDLIEKEKPDNGGYTVTVADLASLMESLQSCLLNYWEYEPENQQSEDHEDPRPASREDTVEISPRTARQIDVATPSSVPETSPKQQQSEDHNNEESDEKTVFKKRPIVFLMDEAHKLPALVDHQLSLKVFLDTLLVLTKQDRLCHVVFSTSDAFFHHFLRAMNVGHHSQLVTVGDCSRDETKTYFEEQIQPTLPAPLKEKLTFDELYDAFGGKLAHIKDYVSSWLNTEGNMTIYQSAIFVQAYTLLQFHLTRSRFETFSPLSVATAGSSPKDDEAKFSADHLMYVMRKMIERPYSLPYFRLCREIGTAEVDSMIKTRILELRWTKSVTPEDTAAEQQWSDDGIERPVVLPMTRMIRRAMEVVLEEEAQSSKSSISGSATSE